MICVQPSGSPAMTRSWHRRRAVTTESTDTIADGVAGRRPIPDVLDDLLLVADDAVLVEEESVVTGMRLLLDRAGLVVEPSAALGVAAVLEDRDRFADRHVVTICAAATSTRTPPVAGSACPETLRRTWPAYPGQDGTQEGPAVTPDPPSRTITDRRRRWRRRSVAAVPGEAYRFPGTLTPISTGPLTTAPSYV